MKKLLAITLMLTLVFSMVACNNNAGSATPTPVANTPAAGGEATPPPVEVTPPEEEGLTVENVKIGFVHITDPSDGGYTYNHHQGTLKMQEALGIRDDQIVNKFNTPEDATCETALKELIDDGCHIIFGTSFGFEGYMLPLAAEYPDIEFCHATGYQAAGSGLPNMHNYFGNIFEARYLSGIVAGLKTQTNKLGYVSAMPFAECISGFTGFYLGAKSVNPDVTMEVMFTNSWNDPTTEAQVAQALITMGCDVIGQHADSTATQTTAEANKVFGVGYNSDMRTAAPNASLTSAVWDWSQFLILAVSNLVNGEAIPTDFSGGLKEGVVDISPLNEAIAPEGAQAAVDEARAKIIAGEVKVFGGPLHGIKQDGTEITIAEGEEFVEPQSAPSWDYIVDGINVNW